MEILSLRAYSFKRSIIAQRLGGDRGKVSITTGTVRIYDTGFIEDSEGITLKLYLVLTLM